MANSKKKKSRQRRSSKSSKTPTAPASSKKTPKRKKVDYRALGPGAFKPVIGVSLVGPSGVAQAPQLALVDSGCDVSTFPAAWAAPLGIDFDKDCTPILGKTASGDDHSQRRYPGTITGIIHGEHVDLQAIFNPAIPIALLGREDFFRHFRVEFDQRKKCFWIQPFS